MPEPTVWVRGPDGRYAKATLADIQRARLLPYTESSAEWANPKYGEYAATSTPTYRAVTLRSKAVAQAPLVVYRRRSGGAPERVGEEHPVQQLLDRVNPWWTSYDLLAATEMNLSLWGSAFWFLEREGAGGRVSAIWSMRPDQMRVHPGQGRNEYIVGFSYEAGGKRVPLTPDEVVWLRYYNPLDEYAGLSPVAAARASLDMGRNAVTFNAAFFRNNAMPQDLIFLTPGPLVDEQVEDFYRRLEKRYKGPEHAHRPMIWDLSAGGEPKRLGLSQRDMEFLATLNYSVEEAARVWGVPPPMLYSQQASTYNNVREARIEFYTGTVAPEWQFIEQEVNEMLMPALGEKGLYVAFDTSNVFPLHEARLDLDVADLEKVKVGVLTINEFRSARNLEPVPWGDVYWVPVGTSPISGPEPPPAPSLEGLMAYPSVGAKALRNPDLEIVGRAFGKRLDAASRRFGEEQGFLFRQQRDDVLRKLRARELAGMVTVQKAAEDLFDPGQWLELYKARGGPLVAAILASAARRQTEEFGLGAFDPRDPAVAQWVEKRVAFWADRVNAETARLITEEMREALSLGEGIKEMQARAEKVFGFSEEFRTERIARTESLVASNQGHLYLYEQSGVVDRKMWLTTLDGREREEHAQAHRQTVGLREMFQVGGESLEAPGVGGSAANVVNCRCAVVPVIKSRERSVAGNGHAARS